MYRWLCLACASLAFSQIAGAQIVSPEQFLKHPVGADRKLASYPKVLEYLETVAANSDRISIDKVGQSTLGNEMWTVVLTSPANQAQLDRQRELSKLLSRGGNLEPAEADKVFAEGKVLALVTCTIHSTEVGCTQMAMEFIHDFATTEDPNRLAWMEDVVLLLMPSINPDGQVMVVDWYQKHLGSEYEGGRMPWLYQHYVGHDNNRDFYMLTQKETQVVNDVLYHRWLPQVFVDEHQMGSTSVRMFVPPQTDPLALEINSLIFRQADLIGTNMSYRLEEAGKLGVGHNMIYDSYWPGGTRNTAWWKNVTGLLTEVASVQIATPIFIDPGELRGGSKGLPEYKRRANFPSPWPGGWWRLRDIVEYEMIATWALVESCSQYREEILRNFHGMAREAVEAGRREAPYAWIIAPEQHDRVATSRLVELLLRHGVQVQIAQSPFTIGRTTYPTGTQVIPAAQPYRAFLLSMLRPQRYPEIRPYVDGPIFPPYDVTSWSLPISMGVDLIESASTPEGDFSDLEEPIWPGGIVTSDGDGDGTGTVLDEGGYLISHADDSAFTAINRLLESEVPVYWLRSSAAEAAGGKEGDIYLPAGSADREELLELSKEFHLPVRSLDQAPIGPAYRVHRQRVGLFKPWVASMDEGWTRFLLDRYESPYISLSNQDVKGGRFQKNIDVLLLPDIRKSIIEDGKPSSERASRSFAPLPGDYAGGIEAEGKDAIEDWVRNGGTLVALDSSTEFAIDLFDLPVRDALANEKVVAPGTHLQILVDNRHPLGYGMRSEEAAYFAGSPAFRTSVPDARFDRRVIARYPDHRDDIVISGYIDGAEHLERTAAVVEYRIGKGRVVLIGFRAQHRAQTLRTFKLLFNSLLLGGLEEAVLGG